MTGIKTEHGQRGKLLGEDVRDIIAEHIAATLKIEPAAVDVDHIGGVSWFAHSGKTTETGDRAWCPESSEAYARDVAAVTMTGGVYHGRAGGHCETQEERFGK
jgi:hypothetical protein